MQTDRELGTPGLDRDLAKMLDLHQRVVVDGHGRIVFVAGEAGSGRSSLLGLLGAELEKCKPAPSVLIGGFDRGRYVPRDHCGPTERFHSTAKRVLSIGEQAVTLASGLVPLAGLVSQILARSDAALKFADGLTREARPVDPSTLMPRLLRELCRERGRVVCIIDDADQAPDGWWMDLVGFFARRVMRDLPLFLVLSIEGLSRDGARDDRDSYALGVARELAEQRLAHLHFMSTVTRADLQQWAGPMTPEVARTLLEVTAGRAGWCAQLWRDWREREVVGRAGGYSRWAFTTKRPVAFGAVEDLLGRRLRQLVGVEPAAIERAIQLLSCAALEGRRFTAEAVADALQRDRDEVNDELDEVLTCGASSLDGIVVEDGSVEVRDEQGSRTLWLYRFKAQLDWLTIRHYGLSEEARRSLGLKLARALEAHYGGETHRVAPVLARLFRDGGETKAAERFRRMATVGIGRDLILWRARNILALPDPEGAFGRASATMVLLEAAEQLFFSGPFQEGFAFAETACRLASTRHDRGDALFHCGVCQGHLGEEEQAQRYLAEALATFRELGDTVWEVRARTSIAVAAQRVGEYDSAREEYRTILGICRRLGDLRTEGETREALAGIEALHGNLEEARAELLAALEIHRNFGNRQREAHAHYELAYIDDVQGRQSEACEEYLRALRIYRELGDRFGEATARHMLAGIHERRGNYAEAYDEYRGVLEIRKELGDRRTEADTRHSIANLDFRRGRYGEARREHLVALGMRRELGNRIGEASSRRALGNIDYQQGDLDSARGEYLAALRIYRERSEPAEESAALHSLASLDYRIGKYERAREQYRAALTIWRRLGNRQGEADTRHALACIEARLGRRAQAREELLDVLAMRRELGDQHGEAITGYELAVIDFEDRDYEAARRGLLAALAKQRALEDGQAEAGTRRMLAEVDRQQAELEREGV